jgi:hypothetical protein
MGNWRKFFWRLWIIATVPWALFVGFFWVTGNEEFSVFVEIGLGVPLVILVLGRGIVWAIDGLKE